MVEGSGSWATDSYSYFRLTPKYQFRRSSSFFRVRRRVFVFFRRRSFSSLHSARAHLYAYSVHPFSCNEDQLRVEWNYGFVELKIYSRSFTYNYLRYLQNKIQNELLRRRNRFSAIFSTRSTRMYFRRYRLDNFSIVRLATVEIVGPERFQVWLVNP